MTRPVLTIACIQSSHSEGTWRPESIGTTAAPSWSATDSYTLSSTVPRHVQIESWYLVESCMTYQHPQQHVQSQQEPHCRQHTSKQLVQLWWCPSESSNFIPGCVCTHCYNSVFHRLILHLSHSLPNYLLTRDLLSWPHCKPIKIQRLQQTNFGQKDVYHHVQTSQRFVHDILVNVCDNITVFTI